MVQFGGHHLALNIAIYRARNVLAPALTGALPASYTEGKVTKHVLGDENDKAFALLAALDNVQHQQATIRHDVSDLLLGPGEDGKLATAVGVKVSVLSFAMLFDLISEWATILDDTHAAPRLIEIRAGLGDTFLAWNGREQHEPGRNGVSYFRIQGPNVWIVFSPQFPGGDLSMHVHTIYRDPMRAYGRRLAQESCELFRASVIPPFFCF